MDFESILHVARKNQMKKPEPVKCLQTKFKPPTKEQKDREKSLSEGVMKFLARKEEEERNKKLEAERRREQLAQFRAKDPKTNKRIQHMLKRTKSASKSVMNDVDQSNTADTLSGPIQPDDDDYGFVSEASSALYNKVMQKMYSAPADEVKFAPSKKPISTNTSNTKERVKMALLRQEEEEKMPHKRKRRKREGGGDDDAEDVSFGAPDRNDLSSRDSKDGKADKPKPKLKAAPPMDFMELLRIAEKKQHEPVVIEPKVKKDAEPEQLMTKKQKEEQRRADELRRQKEARARGEVTPTPSSSATLKRIPKLSDKSQVDQKVVSKPKPIPKLEERGRLLAADKHKTPSIPKKFESETEKLKRERDEALKILKEKEEAFKLLEEKERLIRERDEALAKLKAIEAMESKKKDSDVKSKSGAPSTKDNRRPDLLKNGKDFPPKDVARPNSSKMGQSVSSKESLTSKKVPNSNINSKDSRSDIKTPLKPSMSNGNKDVRAVNGGREFPPKDVRPANGSREFPPKDVRSANGSREFPPRDVRPANGSREFPPRDVRPANGSREFPPRDVRPANGSREFPPRDVRPANRDRPTGKRPMTKEEYIRKKLNDLKKRRIEDSDDEYDSEMDDFIDDGPDATLDGSEDVSDVIKQIFKYDKNKYSRYDDNDECMESNWGQVEKEEKHSARIGYLEDVADMLEEKKALARKKQKR